MIANLVKEPMSRYYVIPNSNLRSYLERQESGNPSVYETQFAKGESFKDVQDEWANRLESIRSAWPSLWDYEMEQQKKAGPMSYQKPLSERMDDIQAYYKFGTLGGSDIIEEAYDDLLRDWPNLRNLRLRSQEHTLERMKKSTNSGAPYFTVKNRVAESILPCSIYLRDDGSYWQKLPDWDGPLTATLGWRGQEGGPSVDDVKQRVLFMFPFAANLEELRLYQVLIEQCQKFNYVPAWNGNDYVDAAVTKLFDTKDPKDLVLCTDFTKFDQHYGPPMQKASLNLLRRVFSGREFDEWVQNVFPVKYNIPLNYKWGWFATGPHGMGSGSGGTNADETLGHKLLQYESAHKAGVKLNPYSMALGDDGLLSYPGISVERVVADYTAHGLDMNETKQSVSTDECIYLRCWHHTNYRVNGICVGVYPTMRALGRMRYMERRFPTEGRVKKLFAMRQLSILNNCQYHPLGREFVKYCIGKDKYRLGYDIPGFFRELDREYEEAKAANALHESYRNEFGNTLPPSQWWVTRIVKELCE